MKNSLLIFGYGDTAKHLAKTLDNFQWNIYGTSRTIQKDDYCQIIQFNTQSISQILPEATHLLISIPPTDDGDIVINKFSELLAKSKHIKWIGYLSSTGVYGDHNGRWVDEISRTIPTSQLGLNRLKAEQQWINFANKNNIALNIFRLAGIYSDQRYSLFVQK